MYIYSIYIYIYILKITLFSFNLLIYFSNFSTFYLSWLPGQHLKFSFKFLSLCFSSNITIFFSVRVIS